MFSSSQSDPTYTEHEKSLLLGIARQGLIAATMAPSDGMESLEMGELPDPLKEWRACFVTLQREGELRGCTGTLMPRQPLAEEVFGSTIQTARSDPRFDPVGKEEVSEIAIALSILTPPQRIDYDGPADLVSKLRPGIDGVTFEYGIQRGTFLPQVWSKITDPIEFLSRLCQKMGLPRTWWMSNRLKVEVYQAVEVSEPAYIHN